MEKTTKNATTVPALVESIDITSVGKLSVTLTDAGTTAMSLYNSEDKATQAISITPVLKEVVTKATEAVHKEYHGKPLSLIKACTSWNVYVVGDTPHAEKLCKPIVVTSFPLLSTERQKDVKELTALINLNVGTLATSPSDTISKKCKASVKKYLEDIISIYFQSEPIEMGVPNLRGKDVDAFLFTTLKADRKAGTLATNGHKSIIAWVELYLYGKMNAFELSVSVNGCTKDVNGVTISNGKATIPERPLSTLDKFHASLATTKKPRTRKKSAK